MRFSVEGVGFAVFAVAIGACAGDNGRRVLISDGDAVRMTASVEGNCPSGWNDAEFDDSAWRLLKLPVAPSSDGGCLRARFDAGADLSRYRWLRIDLTARSAARLSSPKPLGARGLGGINWTTQDDGPTDDADTHYRLDLALFPDLLQAQKNVLALQIAQSERPVAVTAALEVDTNAESFVHAVKGPYLVRPSATGMRVLWETSSAAPSWLVVDGQQLDGGWAVHHDVPVMGLDPGSAHPVFVENAEATALPPDCAATTLDDGLPVARGMGEHVPQATGLPNEFWQYIERRDLCAQLAAAIRSRPSLVRPASPDATVRIVVVGETRADTNASGAVLKAAAGETPDLLVHTGDLVRAQAEQNWQALFDHAQPILSQAPIVPAAGELDVAFGPDRFGQLFAVADADRGLAHAYSIDEGAVHVAVLDSNADLAAQGLWLDADLTRATAAGARHLLVVLHWGPWSSGPQGGNGDAVAAIVPVARRHGVEAIVSGHDAIYEHGVVGGMHYFVSGGGGDGVDVPQPIASTVKAVGAEHYLVIDVVGASLRVRAKGVDGALLDDVTLQNP